MLVIIIIASYCSDLRGKGENYTEPDGKNDDEAGELHDS